MPAFKLNVEAYKEVIPDDPGSGWLDMLVAPNKLWAGSGVASAPERSLPLTVTQPYPGAGFYYAMYGDTATINLLRDAGKCVRGFALEGTISFGGIAAPANQDITYTLRALEGYTAPLDLIGVIPKSQYEVPGPRALSIEDYGSIPLFGPTNMWGNPNNPTWAGLFFRFPQHGVTFTFPADWVTRYEWYIDDQPVIGWDAGAGNMNPNVGVPVGGVALLTIHAEYPSGEPVVGEKFKITPVGSENPQVVFSGYESMQGAGYVLFETDANGDASVNLTGGTLSDTYSYLISPTRGFAYVNNNNTIYITVSGTGRFWTNLTGGLAEE